MAKEVKQLDAGGNVKTNKMSKAKLKSISGKLKKASKAHAGQSQQLDKVISTMKMKKSPAQKRLKVKDMPRKQQMAVKATMADGGKGNPNKMKASALKMKTSPALAKLSSSCKAAARRKFDVYPSAYANMWASKTQKAGKC